MVRIAIFVMNMLLLTGCLKEATNLSQSFYLGYKTELEVYQGRTAIVSGFDKCPDTEDRILFPSVKSSTGCILLSGKSFVIARIVFLDGSIIEESWKVIEGVGVEAGEIHIVRPNGWHVGIPLK